MTRRGVLPGRDAPALAFDLAGDGRFDLATAAIDRFLLIDVYRGRHCPRCHRHLLDLAGKLPAFARMGVSAVAVSMDEPDRAEDAHATWGLGDLAIGHSLTLDDARAWNLYVSSSINAREPGRHFAEPATFLVRPDRTVQMAVFNTTPFARFHFADLLEAVEVIRFRDYPPRGDVDLSRS